MLPVGLLIDRLEERRIILAEVATMALFTLWATQVSTFVWLFILFFLASLGASSSAPGGSKAIAAWFSRSRWGGAMGIRQTGVTIGGLMAALILPPIAVGFGWKVGLGLAAGIPLFTILCFGLFYRELPIDVEEGAAGSAALQRVPIRSMVRNRSFLAATGYAFVLMVPRDPQPLTWLSPFTRRLALPSLRPGHSSPSFRSAGSRAGLAGASSRIGSTGACR